MRRLAWVTSALAIVLGGSCASIHGDGLDETKLPANIQPEYELFAQRCSKCHSLSRALDSGIDDDQYWFFYVEKMRRQPSSGIDPSDEPGILRFLHFYSQDRIRKREAKQHTHDDPPPPLALPTASMSTSPPPSSPSSPSSTGAP